MKIERTYIFNIDKYIELTGDSNKKDNFKILYQYVDKTGQSSTIDIYINNNLNILLGNDVVTTNTHNQPFAKIIFNDTIQYSNFIMPKWLKEFKYIR